MHLSIFLQKEVPDQATGQALFEAVKTKMAEYPDVRVTGSVSEQLVEPE